MPRPVPVALPGGVGCYALAAYRGPARELVLAYKERGRRDLVATFGDVLATGCRALFGTAVCLVPVPSRRPTARRRGGQHMHAVARACAARLGDDGGPATVAPALRLAAGVRDAVGLDRATRAANLRGRVAALPQRVPGSDIPVLLIDDVVTTAATVRACVAALHGAGVAVSAVLTLTTASGER